MARIRSVKPEFWEDETVGGLSFPARLLFLATWNMGDDEGILRWSASLLKSKAFPYDSLTIPDMEKLMSELVASGLVHVYTAARADQPLALIVNLHRHQRINRPSPTSFPTPNLRDPQTRLMYARRDGWICAGCGGEARDVDDITLQTVKQAGRGVVAEAPSNLRLVHRRCADPTRVAPSLTDLDATDAEQQPTGGRLIAMR